jgi:hypothetical protein
VGFQSFGGQQLVCHQGFQRRLQIARTFCSLNVGLSKPSFATGDCVVYPQIEQCTLEDGLVGFVASATKS